MKRKIILIVLLFSISLVVKAQTQFGIKIRAGRGIGSELSLQHNFGQILRFEFDLGGAMRSTDLENYNAVYGSMILQKVFFTPKDNLYWYLGLGGKGGYINDKYGNDKFYYNLCLQIGLEYRMEEIPLQFSFDINSEYGLMGTLGVGVAVRYMFH